MAAQFALLFLLVVAVFIATAYAFMWFEAREKQKEPAPREPVPAPRHEPPVGAGPFTGSTTGSLFDLHADVPA
jgi:hypothetical protein